MAIPIIDFSSILKEGDEDGKKKVIDEVGRACLDFGFFQVVNHGLSLDLMNNAFELSKTFFEFPIDEKLKCKPCTAINLSGYARMDNSIASNERIMVRQPELGLNVFPDNPRELGEKLEQLYSEMQKLGSIVESMINEHLGLPTGFLKKYSDDKCNDGLIAWHYPPAADGICKIGRKEHQDADMITLLFQDEVGGLEVEINGKWIPIVPTDGAIVVNLGVVIQVLSNKRMMAPRHQVLKNERRSRQSFVYIYNVGGDKWIEPLPMGRLEKMGEAPKYRGFVYKEFLLKRILKESNPPARSRDYDIDQYETMEV